MSTASNPFSDQNPYASPPPIDESIELGALGEGVRLADRFERFAGAFLDGLIQLPIAGGLGAMLGVMLVALRIDPSSVSFQLIATILGGAIGIAVFLAINGYLLATQGQTVGKYLVKTRIVSDRTGAILPFGELILKRYAPIWVAANIPYAGTLLVLANALAIFRGNRKCLHDDIAGTKVIKILPAPTYKG